MKVLLLEETELVLVGIPISSQEKIVTKGKSGAFPLWLPVFLCD